MQYFYSFNDYCQKQFGEKIYRLSLDGGMTCPNRDGHLSTGGCIFCSAGGSGEFAAKKADSIDQQIEQAKEKIKGKSSCKHFVAYFQSFTNTYAPVSYLRELFSQAISKEEIIALAIGTRCDCLSDDVIALLQDLNQIKPVWIELGLQTIHNSTHQTLNTHTSKEQFEDALERLTKAGIPVTVHLILGLPGESKKMMLESVEYIAHSPVSGVKLQLLHVLKGTKLAQIYESQAFSLFELEEYCDFVVDCIERLHPNQVLHRITGDGPRSLLIAPLWTTDKKRVLNTIHARFRQRQTYQGRLFKNN